MTVQFLAAKFFSISAHFKTCLKKVETGATKDWKWKRVLWPNESKFKIYFGNCRSSGLLSTCSTKDSICDGLGVHAITAWKTASVFKKTIKFLSSKI